MARRLSIGSWAFFSLPKEHSHTFHELLHRLQHLGFDGVELGCFGDHPSPWSHSTRAQRGRLKRMVAEHLLECSGITVDLAAFKRPGPSILDENPTPYLAAFLGYLSFAADLGIQTLRIDSVEPANFFQTTGQEIDPKLALNRLIAVWDRCSKMAADHGVNVSYEFEPNLLFHQPSEVLAIVDGVRAKGNANFGVLFDTCHAQVCASQPGGALELLQMLQGKINHVHLADSDGSLNEHHTSTHLPLGTGQLDFHKLAPALNACGVPHDWWVVDLCFCPSPWEAAVQSKSFLDRLRRQFPG